MESIEQSITTWAGLFDSLATAEIKIEDDRPELDSVELTGLRFWMVLLAVALAVMIMGLDGNILTTAIPSITRQFDSLNDMGWYGSALYSMGKVYQFFSIKWVFLGATIVFEIGSLIAATAKSSAALIAGRAVLGLGGAGIISGAVIIIARTVSKSRRPVYMGIIGAIEGITLVAAPLLGGALTTYVSWRWCFYINVPLGFVANLVIAFLFQEPPSSLRAESRSFTHLIGRLDLPGTAMFVPAIVCLLLALQWAGSVYSWGNVRIVVLLVIFAILVCGFIAVQKWKGDLGTLPPRIIGRRTVALSAWFSLCIVAANTAITYFLPFYFQTIEGATAARSGVMNLPSIVGLIVAVLASGSIVSRIRYYTPVMILGSACAASGAALITTFQVNTGPAHWTTYQALFGLGSGMSMQQPYMAVQTDLDEVDIPTGTVIIAFAQSLGSAIAVSVAQNVFSSRLLAELTAIVPAVDASMIVSSGATTLAGLVSADALPQVYNAYDKALTQTFYVGVAFSLLALISALGVEWKAIAKKEPEMSNEKASDK